jgi:hypothetical protein
MGKVSYIRRTSLEYLPTLVADDLELFYRFSNCPSCGKLILSMQ